MKKIILLFSFIAAATIATAQNIISIDVTRAKDTINKNVYGHFSEHLGRCIYDGFYVGENNTSIPNKDGVRLDVIAALKK